MSDEYTEVTRTSWGGRIGKSLKNVVFGFFLFIAAFPLLWWNEGRSLEHIKTLEEGRSLVISVSSNTVDPANEKKLIHVSGPTETLDTLSDDVFGVSVPQIIALQRTAEMFQWVEKTESKREKNLGGSETTTKTYKYHKEWSSSHHNSSTFKKKEGHQNPSSMPYQNMQKRAKNVTLGVFQLADSFIGQMNQQEAYPLNNVATMPSGFVKHDNYIYRGTPNDPKIGDVRVSFSVVKPSVVSVIGQQNGNMIQTFHTNNGTIDLFSYGHVDANSMFEKAERDNTILTWGIRVAGIFMIFLGLIMIFRVLSVLGDVIPIMGSIIGAGVGIISAVVALSLGSITIALAWLFYRPVIGIILLVVAGLVSFYGARKIKKSDPVKPNPAV